MSELEQYPVAKVGDPVQDWDERWRSSAIPEEDKPLWRDLIYWSQSPVLAERLAVHGWNPEHLAAAVQDPYYLPKLERRLGNDPELRRNSDTVEEARLLVLADVVSRVIEHRLGLALQIRRNAMSSLAEPRNNEGLSPAKGWTFDRIGELVGLTKQRVRAIVRGRGGH
ncbi:MULTISPECIES: hypothetical protein [unclassified Arthrobacter]|uniref:hypothetical protein n=1 Tax=unclassified Arthrobacter TaxID=235627 RepID=UPI00288302FC|nr:MULTISPECIES: hypothetical protein [unclassified Arthrobacter]